MDRESSKYGQSGMDRPGRHGLSHGRTSRAARAATTSTVYNRTGAKAEAWARDVRRAQRPRRRPRPRQAPTSCSPASATTTTCAQVTIGPDGAFRTMKRGATFVDHTTASAEVARELASRPQASAAFGFIDAPVSGGQAGAENGILTVMVGGDADAFEQRAAAHRAYARTVRLIGPAGSGQLTKMVNQIAIAGLLQGLVGGDPLRREGRPRSRRRHGDDLEGRGAVLADGQPLEDACTSAASTSASRSTGCARISGICLEEAQRNGAEPAGHDARRSVLRRSAEAWAAAAGIPRASSPGSRRRRA